MASNKVKARSVTVSTSTATGVGGNTQPGDQVISAVDKPDAVDLIVAFAAVDTNRAVFSK